MGRLNRRTARLTNGHRQRGDTLVEVMIALGVLGLIMVATTTIINRSLLGVMNAVERTAARADVNSQVEMLRYVFDTQDGLNSAVVEQIINATPTGDTGTLSNRGCSIGSGGFYLSKTTNPSQPVKFTEYNNVGNVADAVFASPTPGKGIWIEGVKSDHGGDSVPGYIDFYVRACWSPYTSTQVGQGRLESTVRVYYKEGE